MPLLYHLAEAAHVHEPVLLGGRVGGEQLGGDDELELAVAHGVRVVDAHGRLQRDEVLALDAVRFLEHLPPAFFAILRLKVVARSSASMMHPYRGTKLSYTTATSPICRFRSDGAKIPGDAGGRESAWDASPARATEGPAAGRRRGSPIGRKGNREYALRCTHCENTHATYYITAGRWAFLVAGKSPLRAMRHGGFCGRGMEIGTNDPRNPACCGGIPNCRPPCPPGALR